MSDGYHKIEVVGTSNEGFDKAVQNAVEIAARTIQNMSWLEVVELRGSVQDGKVVQYQAVVKIAYRVTD